MAALLVSSPVFDGALVAAHRCGKVAESCGRCWELTLSSSGCDILQADDLETWIIKLSVLGETVYSGGASGGAAELEGERS